MQLAFELAVSSQLDKHHLVEQEPHEIEGLRHVVGLLSSVSHGGNYKDLSENRLCVLDVSLKVEPSQRG